MEKIDIYSRFSERRVTDNIKKVSAIIPNYNYADFLQERIDSILNQTYPISELVILDDCSTDNSVEVIKRITAGITSIPVKLIVNENNSGSVFSQWQKGIDNISGDYFWICEADDSADPEFLEVCMKGFDDEEVVLSYVDSARINDQNELIRSNSQDLYNIFDTDHWDKPFIVDGKDEIKQYLSVLNTILNVSGVVWKNLDISQILEEAKRFHVAGDWYIYVNFLERGKVAFDSRCLNYYRKHENSVTSSVKADIEYREICEIEDTIAQKYNVGMDIYKIQRFRRSLMDANVSKDAMKKRIAWVIPFPGEGSGGHRTIIQNINALIRHGYECDIYTPFNGVSNADDVAKMIDDYYEVCAAKVYTGFDHEEVYDVLFATGWQTLDHAKVLSSKIKAYFIQDYEPWFFPMGNEYLIIEDSYRQGYKPITIGRWLSAKLENEFGQKSQYFDFCADLTIYHPIDNVEKENALCYIWQPEKPRRASELAFRALRIVKAERPDIKIYLYGSNHKEKLPFEADCLGIINTEKCNELYNKCKLGLCMSASNPSRIPFEMMAAGLPVVELYKENNLYDMPEDGICLAEPSPEGIATAILRLIDDEAELKKMSDNGYRYMQDYPLEKGFNQFVKAVDNILNDSAFKSEPIDMVYKKEPVTPDTNIKEEAKMILMPVVDRSKPQFAPAEIKHGTVREVLYRLAHGNFADAIDYMKKAGDGNNE